MPHTLDIAGDAARIAALALAEDGPSDVTSEIAVAPAQSGSALIEAREPMVIAGLLYADAVAAAAGLPRIDWQVTDGESTDANTQVGTLSGALRGILRAERPILNLLQRACGIATTTRAYVERVAGTRCRVLHTRKTTPGLRIFEISAVLAGGGAEHRADLSHAVMIKDNHWAALTKNGITLRDALAAATARGIRDLQVEAESLVQVDAAIAAGATRLLVDNQSPDTVREWAEHARARRPGIEIEATGGITLANVRAYADAGVDFVSMGALTHSVRSADLGIELAPG